MKWAFCLVGIFASLFFYFSCKENVLVSLVTRGVFMSTFLHTSLPMITLERAFLFHNKCLCFVNNRNSWNSHNKSAGLSSHRGGGGCYSPQFTPYNTKYSSPNHSPQLAHYWFESILALIFATHFYRSLTLMDAQNSKGVYTGDNGNTIWLTVCVGKLCRQYLNPKTKCKYTFENLELHMWVKTRRGDSRKNTWESETQGARGEVKDTLRILWAAAEKPVEFSRLHNEYKLGHYSSARRLGHSNPR